MRHLPVLDQQVLGLTALEGFSLEETGLALGLSTSAVKSRLYRIRRRLSAGQTPPLLKEIPL